MKYSAVLVLALSMVYTLPALSAPRTTYIQCYWDKPPATETLDLPQLANCSVGPKDANGYYSLTCNTAIALAVGSMVYTIPAPVLLGYSQDARFPALYSQIGFNALTPLAVNMTNGPDVGLNTTLILPDQTGFMISLQIVPSADGKQLVPQTVTFPNVRNPCAISW